MRVNNLSDMGLLFSICKSLYALYFTFHVVANCFSYRKRQDEARNHGLMHINTFRYKSAMRC